MELVESSQPRDARGNAEPALSGSRGTILVVDDLPPNVELLKKLLTREGYRVCSAGNGADALDAVVREHPDLVLTDVMMPAPDGFDVCREIKRNPATRFTPVVLVTGLSDPDDRIKGINAGADDFLSKPFNTAELTARVRSLVRLKRYTDDLDSAEAVITSLAMTIEARDPYTEGHCERLAGYATALGVRLRLPAHDLAALFRGGFLHDVGKVGVADAILHKPAALTDCEFEAMKLHTVIGDRLCGELRALRPVRSIVRHHHERLDGTGYPDGLKGDAIPLLAHMMSIVDVYDALTTDRPYRRATTPEDAFETLSDEVAKGWRRGDLVTEFIAMGRRDDFQRLSSGRSVPTAWRQEA